ncbi:unnamed protein product [Vitrella brassicaformis CCMP3155]|uniref:Uncharacterized protein n=2 Tax=Vitrella brassicaformis TaxID=1169539 RepID=A0A0G4G749_VITBC|nr:unnamed protein product [Vitrella brassicaformis CCMP3155]|mmetsp:Transcript_20007/g.48552  ORF Transcript_20007/g.48552 Transcript_20007/m.48552 type:complete len:194 (+) Transcript_20007:122-703(+)|eukprot:CEM24446.1 unnamed protein product [Vitrella brassicaformis CCMP3155]
MSSWSKSADKTKELVGARRGGQRWIFQLRTARWTVEDDEELEELDPDLVSGLYDVGTNMRFPKEGPAGTTLAVDMPSESGKKVEFKWTGAEGFNRRLSHGFHCKVAYSNSRKAIKFELDGKTVLDDHEDFSVSGYLWLEINDNGDERIRGQVEFWQERALSYDQFGPDDARELKAQFSIMGGHPEADASQSAA